MSRSEIWWSSMGLTSQPQATDTLKLTWHDDPPGSIDLHLYDDHARRHAVLELNAVFDDFELTGRRYRVVAVTRKTPLTHVVEFSSVTLELEPVDG